MHRSTCPKPPSYNAKKNCSCSCCWLPFSTINPNLPPNASNTHVQDEFLSTLKSQVHRRVIVSISPQSRAAIAAHFSVSLASAHHSLVKYFKVCLHIERENCIQHLWWGHLFVWGLKGLGVDDVLDTTSSGDLALLEVSVSVWVDIYGKCSCQFLKRWSFARHVLNLCHASGTDAHWNGKHLLLLWPSHQRAQAMWMTSRKPRHLNKILTLFARCYFRMPRVTQPTYE